MTSMRKSNRTMLASIVALSLCFVLLLGATWAWFQDTVVNSGNSIETGKYGSAVKLEVLGEDNAMWNDVSNPFFTCTNWAPGSTAIRVIRVTNTGTAHLYWDIGMVERSDAGNLSDVVDVYYKWDVTENPTGIDGWEKIGTMTQCMTEGYLGTVLAGELYAGESKNVAIALKMQDGAGNEYQDQTTTFDIRLYATDEPDEGWAIKDSVSVTVGAENKLTENATITSSTASTDATVGEVLVEIPAGVKLDADTTQLNLSVTKGSIPAGVELLPGQTPIALDISLEGLAADNDQEITVTLNIEKDLTDVVLFHNSEEIDCTYDATTGTLTFTTTGFSPFTVLHGKVTTYEVKFVDHDGKQIGDAQTVKHGAAATAPADPTREGYTFKGWDKAFDNVTSDLTVTATYEINEYTVTFMNGETKLQSTEVEYGMTPAYTEVPAKDATAQYTYVFAGWSTTEGGEVLDTLPEVTGAVTYYAVFTPVTNEYTVTFKNGEEVLQTGKVAYGVTPAYTGETPVKAATAQYTYTFAGWDPTVSAVTGEVTYTATFTETVREYTVTWVIDGAESTQTYKYGATPAHADPVKDADAVNTYEFTGWSPAITTVTGNATYTAQFTATPIVPDEPEAPTNIITPKDLYDAAQLYENGTDYGVTGLKQMTATLAEDGSYVTVTSTGGDPYCFIIQNNQLWNAETQAYDRPIEVKDFMVLKYRVVAIPETLADQNANLDGHQIYGFEVYNKGSLNTDWVAWYWDCDGEWNYAIVDISCIANTANAMSLRFDFVNQSGVTMDFGAHAYFDTKEEAIAYAKADDDTLDCRYYEWAAGDGQWGGASVIEDIALSIKPTSIITPEQMYAAGTATNTGNAGSTATLSDGYVTFTSTNGDPHFVQVTGGMLYNPETGAYDIPFSTDQYIVIKYRVTSTMSDALNTIDGTQALGYTIYEGGAIGTWPTWYWECDGEWNYVIVDLSGFVGKADAYLRFDYAGVSGISLDIAYQAFFSSKDLAVAYAAADDNTLGCRYYTYTTGVTDAHKNPTIEDVSLNS